MASEVFGVNSGFSCFFFFGPFEMKVNSGRERGTPECHIQHGKLPFSDLGTFDFSS